MIIKALLLGLIAALGTADNRVFGTSMLNRPLIISPLVGLVLGDLETGIIIGGTLELVWMGFMSIGATSPAEIVTGGVLGTAFAIMSGKGPEVALALAVPIAVMAESLKTALNIANASFCHKADKYAEEGDINGVVRMHLIPGFLVILTVGVVNFLAIILGAGVMESFINSVPTVILDGLNVASGLIPALGFAMLINLMFNKKLAVYFFLGFVLAVYLKLNIIGIAFLGIIIAVIKLQGSNTNVGGDVSA